MADSSPPRALLRTPHGAVALFLGAGLSPVAPGTVGTLAAVPVCVLMKMLPPSVYGIAVAGLFGVGIWACGRSASVLGGKDHPSIVWDEVVGFLLTMALVPVTITTTIAGFILFRLLDVVKPPPIAQIDRGVHGGFGIMLDDAAAGLVAGLLLALGFVLAGG